jgi:glycine/D-amino acid oxidase-like deaminating enzyme
VDLPARWLSPHEVREIASIDAAGAILVTGNAQADPYRLCLGLARAARARGAALHARSRVRRTTSSADGVRLETSRGRIDAGHVIVATGYATPEFKPLAGRFRMYTTYVVTTPRLPAAVRGAIETNVMWWDTNRPYHYARWTSDGRLLFGGEDRRHGPGRARRGAIRTRAQTLMAGAAEMYPILQGVAPAYAWEGLFATTPDGLPYVGAHRRYPKHLFALGYGGNGMTLGFLAAQILQRTLRGRATAEDNLFAFGRDRHA